MVETLHLKAHVLFYQVVSKPQFLNLRRMPHLVMGGHISFLVRVGDTLSWRQWTVLVGRTWHQVIALGNYRPFVSRYPLGFGVGAPDGARWW